MCRQLLSLESYRRKKGVELRAFYGSVSAVFYIQSFFHRFFVEFLIHANKFRVYKYVLPSVLYPYPALALPSFSSLTFRMALTASSLCSSLFITPQKRVKLEGAV